MKSCEYGPYCPESIEFFTQDHFVKHMSITTIYDQYKLIQLAQIGNLFMEESSLIKLGLREKEIP
jgi:hypothetical protein